MMGEFRKTDEPPWSPIRYFLLGAGVFLIVIIGQCAYIVHPVNIPSAVTSRATYFLDNFGYPNVCLTMHNSLGRAVRVLSVESCIDNVLCPDLLDLTPKQRTFRIIGHAESGICCCLSERPAVAQLEVGEHALHFVVDGYKTNELHFIKEPTEKLTIVNPQDPEIWYPPTFR